MESKIKNGVIHTHSEHSCRDSAMSTERYVSARRNLELLLSY